MADRAGLLLIHCWISGISSDAEYSQKPVDISRNYAYRAPGSTDRRGPCPALNALANNGYLNRNGISTPLQLLYWRRHTGCDCNLCPRGNSCDNYDFNGTVWSTTANIAKANGNLYGLPTFKLAAKKRYDQCRATNPKCTFGLIQFAFHYGTACIMAEVFPNGTDKLPTEAIENTWIGIVDDANGQPLNIQGRERIPTNWYPRAHPYGTVRFFSCMRELYTAHLVQLGANINGTFVPDKAQLPANAKDRDIACILYGTLASATPPKLLPSVGKYVNSAFLGHPWHCGTYQASG